MSDHISQVNNKRIAKNATFLYIRMVLSMIVSLYTSRVVLRVLGVEDFGIYGVVGGVVAMLDFLNASMSGATSRFITYELGKSNIKRLRSVFSSSLIIHIGIALTVIILGETIGLYFVSNKLVIPENRMFAAHCVYQLSILAAAVNITQVPYSACIIAHENMDLYAYMEILRVILKLVIVYLLEYLFFDKLILYAILVFGVSFLLAAAYRLYCIKKYDECHFSLKVESGTIKPILSFSGWDLYGNICGTIKQQGTTIILNLFYGPIVNAAASISSTVIGSLSSLSSSTTTAFRPQIIKKYAVENYVELQQLVSRSIGATSYLLSVIAFPLVIEMNLVLTIWLGQVPDHSIILTRIAIFNSLVGNINAILLTPIHATGNVRFISFIGGSLYLLNIVFTYLLLSFFSLPPASVYYVNLIVMILVLVADSIILMRQIPQIKVIPIWIHSIFPIVIYSFFLLCIGYLLKTYLCDGFCRFIIVFGICFIFTSIYYFFCVFDKHIRLYFISKLKKITHFQ